MPLARAEVLAFPARPQGSRPAILGAMPPPPANSSLVAVFPDTNVFLHRRQLREIDWCSLAGSPRVRIVVCVQVLRELDAKKYDARLGDRATGAINQIRVGSSSEIRPGVTVEVDTTVWADTAVSAADSRSGDERIVADVVAFANRNREVVTRLATGDYSMELLAQAKKLSIQALPEDTRLQLPEDDQGKKLARLQAENERLKNRLPDLSVCAYLEGSDAGDGKVLRVKLEDSGPKIDPATELASEHRAHRYLGERRGSGTYSYGIIHASADELERHDRGLDQYFEKLVPYWQTLEAWRERNARTLKFDLWVNNAGTAPAKDIDLKFELPESVEAFQAEKASEHNHTFSRPAKPSLPDPPRSMLEGFPSGRWDPLSRLQPIPSLYRENLRVHGSESGTKISVVIDNLKHHQREPIGLCWVRLRPGEHLKPCRIRYEFSTASHPDLTSGELVFIPEKPAPPA